MARLKGAKGSGRISTFDEAKIELIKYMCKIGKTNIEIAEELGCCEKTIYNWKKEHPLLLQTLNDWKHVADEKVERSLYERASGYTVKETKAFVIDGQIVTQEVDRHFPPDSTSMIFWLKNRKPKEWKDKREVESNGSIEISVDREDIDL